MQKQKQTKEDDFYSKRITQTEYRGKFNTSHGKNKNYLKTELKPLDIDKKYKPQLVIKIKSEVEKFVKKILPEENIDSIINGKCMNIVLKNLGLKDGKDS